MDVQYNVYFTGEVLPDHDANSVRTRLAQLFKADEATLDRLFSGTAQLLKRECDKATALKYKQAMERAGARPVIRRVADTTAAATPAPSPAPQARKMTAAERIAAIAAGDDTPPQSSRSRASGPAPEQSLDSSGISIAPPGTAVLKPEERRVVESREIDTSAFVLDANGERLSAASPPPPPAPSTEHLSMGAVGEVIPTLPRHAEAASPDISAIALAPEGSDFSDCAQPAATAPELDLSQLELAAAGEALLEGQYRNQEPVHAPDTSHLKLDD